MKLWKARQIADVGDIRWNGLDIVPGFPLIQRNNADIRLARYFRNHDRFALAVEQPCKTSLWGQPQTVMPAAVRQIFGNGRILLGLAPLNTRPNHYMLRVDSRWFEQNEYGGWSTLDCFYDELDRIYESIEWQFGGTLYCKHDEECDDCECCEHERVFPRLDLTRGSGWGVIKWAELIRDLDKARTNLDAKKTLRRAPTEESQGTPVQHRVPMQR